MDTWSEIRRARAVFEDDAVLVLDKPTGIAVTGERHDLDLVELAKAEGEWLMPAHRIDKVTSGVILFAKSPPVHADLARQFNRRSVDKTYLAITRSSGLPALGTIDLPLGVGRKNRVRIAAPRERIEEHPQPDVASDGASSAALRWTVPATHVAAGRTYPSLTTFAALASDEQHTLLAVRPVTGRRHQIRVHLAWIGHPIEGDPLFDKAPTYPRTFLHSWRLSFDADWDDGARVDVRAEPDDAFWEPLGDRFGDQPVAILETRHDLLADLDRLAANERATVTASETESA